MISELLNAKFENIFGQWKKKRGAKPNRESRRQYLSNAKREGGQKDREREVPQKIRNGSFLKQHRAARA